ISFSYGYLESLRFINQRSFSLETVNRVSVGIKVEFTSDGDKCVFYSPYLTFAFDAANNVRCSNVVVSSPAISAEHYFLICPIYHYRCLGIDAIQQDKPDNEKINCPCREGELRLPPPFPRCWKPYPG